MYVLLPILTEAADYFERNLTATTVDCCFFKKIEKQKKMNWVQVFFPTFSTREDF